MDSPLHYIRCCIFFRPAYTRSGADATCMRARAAGEHAGVTEREKSLLDPSQILHGLHRFQAIGVKSGQEIRIHDIHVEQS
jgi:hypothetical protein